jgi:hypothetical protein
MKYVYIHAVLSESVERTLNRRQAAGDTAINRVNTQKAKIYIFATEDVGVSRWRHT